MRTLSALCCLIVGLEILIGVPVLVCLMFFGLAGGGVGPVAVEVHAGRSTVPPIDFPPFSNHLPSRPIAGDALTLTPPPNVIPPAGCAPLGNPILESRAQQGSPLAGTVMSEAVYPEAEEQLFVAAFEKVAADKATAGRAKSRASPDSDHPGGDASTIAVVEESPDQFVVRHLYAMAHRDEQAGNYERADQWRALGRDIRAENETE